MEEEGVEGALSKGLFYCCPCLVTACGLTLFPPQGLTVAPARLFCPWDFPSKNTGVGCHFLLPGIQLEKSRLWLSTCCPRPAASASPGNLLEIQYSIRMTGDQTQQSVLVTSSPDDFFLFFFFIFFISWRLITLQYWSGFCHTLK